MFKCPRCTKEFDSYKGLSLHTAKSYSLKGEQLYREYHGITEIVTCKCGCGTPTKWRIDTGYNQYVAGHNSRGENNVMFGKTHSDEAKQNISQKRKEKFANGKFSINKNQISGSLKKLWSTEEYKQHMKYSREQSGWREKLSKAKTGQNNPWYGKKRPDHSKLMKTPEMLGRVFAKRSMTDIEQIVADKLDELSISYHSQFFLTEDGDTFAYDFKLKGVPVLIEVDGDYWHGGPGVDAHVEFLQEIQEKDALKDKIATRHGYTVLRVWGSEVKDSTDIVVKKIVQCLAGI